MRPVAIVQARMGSTRLPGKVLADLAGRPMLEQQLRRMSASRTLDEIVLAISERGEDDALLALAERLGLRCVRGPEQDVLGRYRLAAAASDAELVVRVTADCPLIDAAEIDAVVEAIEARRRHCDYASNRLRPQLPIGLDVEALWRDVLERADRMAESRPAREHVTWLCYGERPDLFACEHVARPFDDADLRLTVDTEQDLALVRALYEAQDLDAAPRPIAETIAYLRAHPELVALNAGVVQKDPATER